MIHRKITFGVVIMITLGTTILANITFQQQSVQSVRVGPIDRGFNGGTQPAISGDNVYAVWFTNKSGNWEVLFRASTDGGKTFSDKINLSNSSDSDSTRAQVDSDGNNVVITWWETNDTSDIPVMRVSDDNGATFGPLLELGTNGTIRE